MPSTTSDTNQQRDDVDDLVFASRSGTASPLISPSAVERLPSPVLERQMAGVLQGDNNSSFETISPTTPLLNMSESGQFFLVGIL